MDAGLVMLARRVQLGPTAQSAVPRAGLRLAFRRDSLRRDDSHGKQNGDRVDV